MCLRAGAHCQASLQAQYRRRGFVCRNGKLARLTPPPPPLPPPPPPLATPGHYASDGGILSFDVGADGRTITNVVEVRILLGCQPPNVRITAPVSAPGPFPIQEDKSFSVDYSNPTGTGKPHLTVSGTFDAAGNASGTLTIQASLDIGTQHYDCGGSPFAWTATRQ